MNNKRTFAGALTCVFAFVFTNLSAGPAAAEVTGVAPGAMRCDTNTIIVHPPAVQVNYAYLDEHIDTYIPVLQWLDVENNRWVDYAAGDAWQKHRYTEEGWVRADAPTERAGNYHTFTVPAQKGLYWQVQQGVLDGETKKVHVVYANLLRHNPDYCDATGPWD